MGFKLGMNAIINYCAAGSGGSPSWSELENVKDVTLNVEKAEADVTTRGNNGWRAVVGTLKEGTVEFQMVWDTGNAGFTAIKDSFLENTVIGLQVLDEEDGEGLQGDFMITNFSRTEPLEEAIMVSVTAKLTYSATAPVWVEPD